MLETKSAFETNADNTNRMMTSSRLLKMYPFLSCSTIGYSRVNRPIRAFRLGNEHEQVLLCGGFHGMEWITTQLLFKYIDEVCRCVIKGKSLSGLKISRFLNKRGLIIIPCINPDGVEIAINGAKSAGEYACLVEKLSKGNTANWQANAAGVDINHNFDADWQNVKKNEIANGFIMPGPTRYGGEKPESEPETQVIATFCRNNNIRHALAFHSQGEEIYWNFGENTPSKSKLMADIMARSSGYVATQPEGIAVGGGFKDWFISELKKPAFTIEVGKGENPLPISHLNSIYETLEEMITLSVIM